jgi:hypothetical protein
MRLLRFLFVFCPHAMGLLFDINRDVWGWDFDDPLVKDQRIKSV